MDPKRLFVLLALFALAWPEAEGAVRAPLASNEMPVEIYGGYLAVAQGSANGLTNLRFLLDTGATDTAISRAVAQKLHLQAKPTRVTSFQSTADATWTALADLTFGPRRASNIRVLIEDLSYFERMGIHIDGVIGLDQLRRQSFVIDYASKSVRFGPAATAGMRAAPMLTSGNVLEVQAELDSHPMWMVPDTGAPATVLYQASLEDLAVSYRLEAKIDWLSLTGRVDSRVVSVPRFRMGGQDLGRNVILVNVPGAKRLAGVSGYLGIAALQAKEVAFDFEGNQLLWKK